jgi:hypothetical protein
VLEVEGDPLAGYARTAAALMPQGSVAATARANRGSVIAEFLGSLD